MCAIVGVVSDTEVVYLLKRMAYKHQHRSHRSGGITTYDAERLLYHRERGVGKFPEIFTEEALARCNGNIGIVHLRWATKGELTLDNVHPLSGTFQGKPFFLAHNGEISFRQNLEKQFSDYQPSVTADTKFIVGLIEKSGQKNFVEALQYAFSILKGTYSLVILYENTLYAVRDVTGNRPLFLGRRGDAVCVASESSAFAVARIPLENIREINAGEMVIVHGRGLRVETKHILAPSDIPPVLKICLIELIYSMYPTTVIVGRTVQKIREQLGFALAQQYRPQADIVIGVPDSGLDAARGFAGGLGLPLVKGLIRYHYVGRIFYYGMGEREDNYELKYDAVEEELRGKRVTVVDDTMFASDTIKKVLNVCMQAGVKEVHIAIPSPMIVLPCFYGTPTSSDHRRLIARDHGGDLENIRSEINQTCGGIVASIGFLPLEEVKQAVVDTEPFVSGYQSITTKNFCDACFLGGVRHIPVDIL